MKIRTVMANTSEPRETYLVRLEVDAPSVIEGHPHHGQLNLLLGEGLEVEGDGQYVLLRISVVETVQLHDGSAEELWKVRRGLIGQEVLDKQ